MRLMVQAILRTGTSGSGIARAAFTLALLGAVLLAAAGGCNRATEEGAEYVYVTAPEVALRDRLAVVYNKVAVVTSGDRLRVLEHSQNRRFIRVRTAAGIEGWMSQRYVVGQKTYDGFLHLARDNANAPMQSKAVARLKVNMHLTPERESESLYQLQEGDKVELLKRAITPKDGPKPAAMIANTKPSPAKQAEVEKAETGSTGGGGDKDADAETDEPAPATETPRNKAAKPPTGINLGGKIEDWWLVRDAQNRYGWVLGRMLDVDIPLEIAQYAEGQRIVASFVLNQARDGDDLVSQYAVLMTEPKDGLPYDFNQLRVFTWNVKRHRYETAYRERFPGELPWSAGKEDFGKEGALPVFTVHARDAGNKLIERKYKLNSVIVRRVPAPGETPANQASRKHR